MFCKSVIKFECVVAASGSASLITATNATRLSNVTQIYLAKKKRLSQFCLPNRSGKLSNSDVQNVAVIERDGRWRWRTGPNGGRSYKMANERWRETTPPGWNSNKILNFDWLRINDRFDWLPVFKKRNENFPQRSSLLARDGFRHRRYLCHKERSILLWIKGSIWTRRSRKLVSIG